MNTKEVTIPEGSILVYGRTCSVCGDKHSVVVKKEDLDKFESGEASVQSCFPYVKKEDREILLSGINGECWIKLFGEEEE